jgi:hypothetical protein
LFLPPGMSRRRENDSFYDAVKQRIMWRCSCVFGLNDLFSIPELINYDVNKPIDKIENLKANAVGCNLLEVDESLSIGNMLEKLFSTLQVRSDGIHCLLYVALQYPLHFVSRDQ